MKHTSVVTTGLPDRPDVSCAMGLTAYFVISSATGLSCHRRLRGVPDPWGRHRHPANLTPASGFQDHTTSPSAAAPFVTWRRRVHRIPPRVRDDRDTPLCGV